MLNPFTGFVYAIQAVDGGPVKIGWSEDPAKRLGQIQGSHHASGESVASIFEAFDAGVREMVREGTLS